MSHARTPPRSSAEPAPSEETGPRPLTSDAPPRPSARRVLLRLAAAAVILALIAAFALLRRGGEREQLAGVQLSHDEAAAADSVSRYVSLLSEGRAQGALALVDTRELTDFSPNRPQFSDEFYTKVKSRPERFTVRGAQTLADGRISLRGDLVQGSETVQAIFTLVKTGQTWRLEPSSTGLLAPTVDGASYAFPLTVNGTPVDREGSILSNILPGDYEFTGTNNAYYTSNTVTKRVWASGIGTGSPAVGHVRVKATEAASERARQRLEDALRTCAAAPKGAGCGPAFSPSLSGGRTSGLSVAVAEMPQIAMTPVEGDAAQFTVSTTSPGLLAFRYMKNGKTVTERIAYSPEGTAVINPAGDLVRFSLS